MRILGVDPGLQVTGYGVIAASGSTALRKETTLLEAGVIRTKAGSGIASRLEHIFSQLSAVIDEFQPSTIAIEKLYAHYKHPSTAILMAHSRGTVCLLSGIKKIPLVSIASTHVKKAVTGHGHAGKEQVARMVLHYLGLKSSKSPADATDALAVALAYAFNTKSSQEII
jgi:crossover junction endodeoxyribonuclease RuvC